MNDFKNIFKLIKFINYFLFRVDILFWYRISIRFSTRKLDIFFDT